MDEREFAELASGFALDALSPADRRAFDEARAAHPEWEHWVESDVATAAALGDGVPDEAPPLTLRSTLLSRIATMPQLPDITAADAAVSETWPTAAEAEAEASDDPDEAPAVDPAPTTATIQAISRRNWTRGLLTLAASIVVLVVLGFGAASINQFVNRSPEVVALQEIEAAPDSQSVTAELDDGGTMTAHWSESVGKAVVVSAGLPEIADDESFELWFVRDGAAVSAGTFEPTATGGSTALLEGAMEPGDVIAVTVEPQGGSPDGQPTSDPIVQIPTA
ncbi:anti-sigma factor [Microbacterium sp. SSM24]|uniref:anti-sigma factor n=1 Tax=Microbacterium sp. SSM24 TaxID=2991714 RepID=UPI002227BF47|nr:anti-sigma factor [Microbacterium sp. SSM24]MCW3492022.1 anti-sigma factor [Microbacterium sp. SSM24]